MFNRFSTYRRPINVCLPQSFQLPPQYFMLRERTIWVFIHNSLCHFTDILQQLSVAGYIRYFQIKGDAALLGSFQITGTTQFQVRLCYLKTIVCTYHNLDTFPGIFRQFITGHQNTIRLVGALHDHGADEAGKVRNVRHSLLSSRKH